MIPAAADTLTVIANIGALVAAAAGLAALFFAWRAVVAARKTIELAKQTREDAELDRHRQRLERVGRVVERIYWTAKGGYTVDTAWMQDGNVLKQALVGLEGELPECAAIPGLPSASMAKAAASRARDEIRNKLDQL